MSDATAGDGPPQHDEYVVVARRYRPQTFDELIGQGHVAVALKQAIATGRVGHAYLFTGARGVGKTSAARIMAKALNCIQGPTATPCGECDICRGVTSGDDVDVLEIDGASNRGIDEIRQLRQNVAIRPSRSRFKVYIIDEVHMLTKEAFNALLKTLEEPPEHVKFIFATTEPNKIPITILSRCQRFDFAGIESTAIQTRLAQIAEAEGVTIEAEALQILAMRAAGSMRDSQSLLEQLLAIAEGVITGDDVNELLGIAPAKRIGDLARRLADRDAAGALGELHQAIAGGAEVGQLIDQLLGYFRDVMAVAAGAGSDSALYAVPSQADEVRALGESLGIHKLLAIMQVLDETAARFRMSVHGRTLAEMAVVRVCHLEDLDDLATLVASLREGTPRAASGASAAPTTPRSAPTPRPAKPQPAPEVAPPHSAAPSPSAPPPPHRPPEPPAASQASPEIPAVAATPVSPQEQSSRPAVTNEMVAGWWKQTAAEIGDLVGASAAMASSVLVKGNDLVLIRFDQPGGRDICEAPANKHRLEQTFSAHAGRRMHIEFESPAITPDAPGAGPRVSRRQKLAEVAQLPFVQAAMELFDVPPDKLRYTPPPSP